MVARPAHAYACVVRNVRVRFGFTALAASALACALLLPGCIGYPRGARSCSMRAGAGSSTVCAFGLPGVRASVTDLPDGVELSFSAVGDASELRRRAHDVVEGSTEPGAWRLPPESERVARKAHLSFVDGPRGVIVVARAIDPDDLPEIRTAVHHRFDRTRSTACN
jgi:hypothetical protein